MRRLGWWLAYRIVLAWPLRWFHSRPVYWLLPHAGSWVNRLSESGR